MRHYRHTLLVRLAAIATILFNVPAARATDAKCAVDQPSQASLNEIRELYKELIDAENRHDIDAVRRFVWNSPNALFVAKTATAAEGNWAGFWGRDVVLAHLDELYKAGPFHIEPDYAKEKEVALSCEVAETYVPVSITVAYAGQIPVPKPFLMILEWVRTAQGWRMATDIALPIPPAPATQP